MILSKAVVGCSILPGDWERIGQLAGLIEGHVAQAGWISPTWQVRVRDRQGEVTAQTVADAARSGVGRRRAIRVTEIRVAESRPSVGSPGRTVLVLLTAGETGHVEVSSPDETEAVGLAHRTKDLAPPRRWSGRGRRWWRRLRAWIGRQIAALVIALVVALIMAGLSAWLGWPF